jgi:hypothetical protein
MTLPTSCAQPGNGKRCGGATDIRYLHRLNGKYLTMKFFNFFLAILFLVFAAVQFNDDPDDIVFWVLIYTLVAIVSAFAAFKKYNMWVIVLGIAAVVYELFREFPAFAQWISKGMPSIVDSMEASSPHIEYVREYLGLVICLIVLIFHYVMYARQRALAKD